MVRGPWIAVEDSSIKKRCPECERIYAATEKVCSRDATTLVDVEVDDPLLGEVVADRYEVQRVIGAGGGGQVYHAFQKGSGLGVALKVMRYHDPRASERFKREVAAVAALKSPHTVRLVDSGELDDGRVFIAMEHLEGETLRQRLQREGALDVELVFTLLDGLAASVSEAHAAGLVHRDIKPSNVFIATTYDFPAFVKLLDFGIARRTEAGHSLTDTGAVPGTPAYIAPELVVGGKPTAASDVYAMGMVAYEMLTAQTAFTGSRSDILGAHVMADIPDLTERLPALPHALSDLIHRCLAKEAALRPADATAFRTAVAAARVDRSPSPHMLETDNVGAANLVADVERPPPPPAKPRWLMVVAAAALIGLGLLGGSLLSAGPRTVAPGPKDAAARPAAPAKKVEARAVRSSANITPETTGKKSGVPAATVASMPPEPRPSASAPAVSPAEEVAKPTEKTSTEKKPATSAKSGAKPDDGGREVAGDAKATRASGKRRPRPKPAGARSKRTTADDTKRRVEQLLD